MNLILSSIVFPSYLHDLRVVHQVQLQRGPRHGQLLHRHHYHRGRRRRSAIFGLVRLVLRRRSRRRRLWRISARASAPQRDENLRYKKTIYYLGTLQKMASRFTNSNKHQLPLSTGWSNRILQRKSNYFGLLFCPVSFRCKIQFYQPARTYF